VIREDDNGDNSIVIQMLSVVRIVKSRGYGRGKEPCNFDGVNSWKTAT
jgi:hypothetical protein